ncbi:hypothetical protein BHE74_00015614 [Ensete ventricosum]|nr:hypothetical protein BHE74_00015614 [Ensete ventricosum]
MLMVPQVAAEDGFDASRAKEVDDTAEMTKDQAVAPSACPHRKPPPASRVASQPQICMGGFVEEEVEDDKIEEEISSSVAMRERAQGEAQGRVAVVVRKWRAAGVKGVLEGMDLQELRGFWNAWIYRSGGGSGMAGSTSPSQRRGRGATDGGA